MNGPKAYVSQLHIHFGSCSTVGALYPIRRSQGKGSNKPQYKYCTPDGKPVSQVYVDEDGNKWSTDQLMRTDGEQIVSTEAVAKAKSSDLPANVLNLTAHSREEVDQFIFPSDNQAYIFKPLVKGSNGKEIKDPINVQWHDFLNTMVAETNLALIGVCNLRNHEGLFRVGMYQGHLTIQKQLYPEDLNQFERVDNRLDAALRSKVPAIASKALKPFDASEYHDAVAERLRALQGDQGEDGGKPLEFKTMELDMAAALDSFVV